MVHPPRGGEVYEALILDPIYGSAQVILDGCDGIYYLGIPRREYCITLATINYCIYDIIFTTQSPCEVERVKKLFTLNMIHNDLSIVLKVPISL